MSKGSGTAGRADRGSAPGATPGPTPTEIREERYEKLLGYIQNGRDVDDIGVIDDWDAMRDDERELALMQGGFTGILPDNGLENFELMYPGDKKELVARLAEDISNSQDGRSMADVSWTVGLKGGRTVYLMDGEDTLGSLGVTSNQSFKTQKAKVASALADTKIDFIIRQDGFDQPRYYATRTGLKVIKEYTGGEVWRNGRGEKRRDYIQDDWI